MTWLEPIEIISGFTTPNFFVFPKPFPPLLLSLLIHCDVDIFSGLYPVFILQNYAWTRSVNWPWGKITQIFNNNKQTSGSNSSFLKTSQSEIRLSLVFDIDFNYRHKNHLFFFSKIKMASVKKKILRCRRCGYRPTAPPTFFLSPPPIKKKKKCGRSKGKM